MAEENHQLFDADAVAEWLLRLGPGIGGAIKGAAGYVANRGERFYVSNKTQGLWETAADTFFRGDWSDAEHQIQDADNVLSGKDAPALYAIMMFVIGLAELGAHFVCGFTQVLFDVLSADVDGDYAFLYAPF